MWPRPCSRKLIDHRYLNSPQLGTGFILVITFDKHAYTVESVPDPTFALVHFPLGSGCDIALAGSLVQLEDC
jgi:hypothetical protein